MSDIITENKTGCYIARNKLNKKVYIGKSLDCIKRRREHENLDGTAKLFQRAIKKNGVENFDWEFRPLKEEDLTDMEVFLIAEYKSNVYRHKGFGYNMTDGGEGVRGYKLSKEKIRQIIEKRKWYRHSEDALRKISEWHKGHKYNVGRKHTDETKENMRNAKLGKKRPEWVKKKISLGKMGEKNHFWRGGSDRICPRCKTNKVGLSKTSKRYRTFCDGCTREYDREKYYLKRRKPDATRRQYTRRSINP